MVSVPPFDYSQFAHESLDLIQRIIVWDFPHTTLIGTAVAVTLIQCFQ